MQNINLRTVRDLPGPRPYPVIGNLGQFKINQLHLALEQWAKRFSSPFSIRIGSRPVVIWTNPKIAKAMMLERPYGYRRYSPIEAIMGELLCNGLFSAEGQRWEGQRKMVMQALSPQNVERFYPQLFNIVDRLRRRWVSRCHGVLDMCHELELLTVDATSSFVFGYDVNTIEFEENAIQKQLKLLFPAIMRRINAPLPYWRYLKMPADIRVEHALSILRQHIQDLIVDAQNRLLGNGNIPQNLLETMIFQRDQAISGLTSEDIEANILTLLLAGEDTTTYTLSWAIWFLAQNPSLQQRLRDEATDTFGTNLVCPSYKQAKLLNWCEACCLEAIRLKPVASLQSFEPLTDVVVDNVHISKGTWMFFVARPSCVDENNFANPAKYDPQRWLSSSDANDRSAFLQFGYGPRVCPGRSLALLEMRLVLSMLVANFRFELATDADAIKEVQAFTMMPTHMPVKLTAIGV